MSEEFKVEEKIKPKKQKKVKVVYDVEGKMKKKKARDKSGLGKFNIIALIIFILAECIFYYICTPAINIHTVGFWVWLAMSIFGILICTLDYSASNLVISLNSNKLEGVTKSSKWFAIAAGACIAIPIVGGIASSAMFRASTYASVIQIEDGDFAADIAPSENINDIALMDTESAKIIGDRAIGSLSDVVSQYEVSDNYSTIDYNGKPMKVATLEYAGFFKWLNNKDAGIPGYVLVDPVKNEAKYIKLDKPIKYTPSGCFGDNLKRHVQMSYPTYEFNGFYFELDNEGNPYYICPVLKPNAGLFGAKDVKGIVICDPCTGDCEYLEIGNIPNWVDRVYDGELACQKYNWYGNLSGGFINSIIGNKGCKITTDDYGYKVMNGDVWVYTGVTSVNGDQSNIGFVMMNSRTGESKYYNIAGAEEHSAMSSAEGQVQNLGYDASFPSLININNIPTYIMVLKDNAGLVKMYALVNVEKYNIVATGTTQREALNGYKKLLAENGIITNQQTVTEDMPGKKIKVADIKYVNIENETFVYITDKNGEVYKQNFAENEELIFINVNDEITVYYIEDENKIHELISYE